MNGFVHLHYALIQICIASICHKSLENYKYNTIKLFQKVSCLIVCYYGAQCSLVFCSGQ